MRTTTRFALATVALMGTACGGIPITAGADLEPGYDLTQYTSYTWDEPDGQPTGDPRLDNNPFFVHRMHSAIHWELATRGIEYNAEGPALTVHHHAIVRDRVEVYEADRTAGYTTEYGDGTQVIQYEEGTFLVDVADARCHDLRHLGQALAAQLIGNDIVGPHGVKRCEAAQHGKQPWRVGHPLAEGTGAGIRLPGFGSSIPLSGHKNASQSNLQRQFLRRPLRCRGDGCQSRQSLFEVALRFHIRGTRQGLLSGVTPIRHGFCR